MWLPSTAKAALESFAAVCVCVQIKEGNEAAHKAKRGVRQAVVRCAEVVACTLSSAGGDLLSLVKGVGSDPSMLFQAIMIDEVCPIETVPSCCETYVLSTNSGVSRPCCRLSFKG